jgi:hypothetical protein
VDIVSASRTMSTKADQAQISGGRARGGRGRKMK